MKTIILSSILTTLSFVATAQSLSNTKASTEEKKILCSAVEKSLAGYDLALDTRHCLNQAKISSVLVNEGAIELSGNVRLISPETTYTRKCTVSYDALTNELFGEADCVEIP